MKSPFTIVSMDYTSGIVLNVEDSSNFADNDLILVGGLGNEKAETTDLTATPPSASTLSITAMDHPHSSDESVEPILWNQFDIEYKMSKNQRLHIELALLKLCNIKSLIQSNLTLDELKKKVMSI